MVKTLLAVNAASLSGVFNILADLHAGVYNGAVLLHPDTKNPYAIFSRIEQKNIVFAASMKNARRHFNFRETMFDPAALQKHDLFETTAPRFIGMRNSGKIFGLASLDCCAFLDISYPETAVWKEDDQDLYRITFSVEKAYRLKASPSLIDIRLQQELRASLSTTSLYLNKAEPF